MFAKLRESPRVVGIAAILVIIVAVFLAIKGYSGGGGGPKRDAVAQETYFDENTRQFSQHPVTDLPPIDGTVVRAVMRPGPQTPENIIYLFRFTDTRRAELSREITKLPKANQDTILLHENVGKEVRTLTSNWLSAESPEGQQIMNMQ